MGTPTGKQIETFDHLFEKIEPLLESFTLLPFEVGVLRPREDFDNPPLNHSNRQLLNRQGLWDHRPLQEGDGQMVFWGFARLSRVGEIVKVTVQFGELNGKKYLRSLKSEELLTHQLLSLVPYQTVFTSLDGWVDGWAVNQRKKMHQLERVTATLAAAEVVLAGS